MKVKPENVDEMLESISGLIQATRDRDGCIEVYIYQDQDDPTTLLALQEWETREQYEEYFAWRGEIGDLDMLRKWQTQPMSLRFFDKKI
jgi:quinol monooxygenase YgiN